MLLKLERHIGSFTHFFLSKIGVMEALSANTTVGNHTLDEFGHHGYGVSPHNGRYEARYSRCIDQILYSKSMDNWGGNRETERPR